MTGPAQRSRGHPQHEPAPLPGHQLTAPVPQPHCSEIPWGNEPPAPCLSSQNLHPSQDPTPSLRVPPPRKPLGASPGMFLEGTAGQFPEPDPRRSLPAEPRAGRVRGQPCQGPTCLLCPCLHGDTAGPVPGRVEGGHADPVGGVARQVLQLHRRVGQEKGLDPPALVLPLLLPEMDLREGERGAG